MTDVRVLRIKEHISNRIVRPSAYQISQSNKTLIDSEFSISLDMHRFMIGPYNQVNAAFPKIVIMGDSIAECVFVPEGKRITDLLNLFVVKGLLNEKYEFLNAACSGNTTLHMMVVYLAKIMPINPRHLIVLLGSIDAGACRGGYNYWTPVKGTSPFTYTRNINNLTNKKVNFEYREALIVGLNEMCNQMQTTLHLATMPITSEALWHQEKNIYNIDEVINLRREINENSRQIAKKHQIKMIDLELLIGSRDDLFYDIEHLNEYGSEIVSGIIKDYINSFE